MPIVPDDKNWTWVLERPCPECGFDAASYSREATAAMIRDNAAVWQTVLARPEVQVRPDDSTWSPLEYACHVRDVFRIYDCRLELMLTEDDPLYPNWDQDVTAIEERYREQDPATVGRAIDEAAEALADRLARVHGEQWNLPGTRSDGAHFTVESFARYLIHDPIHHLHDVGPSQ